MRQLRTVSHTDKQSTAAKEHFIFGYSLRTIGLTDNKSTTAGGLISLSIHLGHNHRHTVNQSTTAGELYIFGYSPQLALQITNQQQQEDFFFVFSLVTLKDNQSTAGEHCPVALT